MANFKEKIISAEKAAQIRTSLSEAGSKLVFTTGCFDLLHPGHLFYLAEAKALGDFLMVGLNSDDSIRRCKGPSRPVLGEDDRALMLAALVMVDGVVIFGEDTPLRLIEKIKPDVLAKGGDWAVQDIVGGPETLARGGEVKSLSYKEGLSTTSIIERILKSSKSAFSEAK
ncbi:MAG: D-glycero-beta-D-manno-heptose 1-phosphate adenylyltransferase [Deltaproteobacteria bacterium]|jgi:D-beta-D-heptose 7-phosphate kinase/D-beta-D-heptose 1-phosphate adenosyltransferase|nr:D-glycero-beta-D-manno-heptose 1-phosphate adenylyltransferase [Deltaproteobacteria bacterium]